MHIRLLTTYIHCHHCFLFFLFGFLIKKQNKKNKQTKNTIVLRFSTLHFYTKQSDGEVPVMLELWGIRSIPLLPSLPVYSYETELFEIELFI